MSNLAKFAVALGAIGLVGMGVAVISENHQTSKSPSYSQPETVSEPKTKAPVERIEEEQKTESIGYETEYADDYDLEYGKTSVRAYGQNGVKTYTYRVVYLDDQEQSRELIGEEVTKQPVNQVIANGKKVVWHCVDATSYDRNAYNDNRCTSSTGEVRLLSDSQAESLDPSYHAGKSGAYYYNSK